jgi:hypothetical protein
MLIGLLGTGFGVAHAGIYHRHPAVDEVIVFGRTQSKLEKIAAEFGSPRPLSWPRSMTTLPSISSTCACPPSCTPTTSCAASMPASTCSASFPSPTTSPTPSTSSTPTPPATRTCSSTCPDASIPAPSSCTPRSPTTATGPSRSWRPSFGPALLWEGYEIRLDSIAMDVMHGSLDTIVTALGRPTTTTAIGVEKESGGSAGEVLLDYPGAIVRCSASALMPEPYGLRGGSRATFSDASMRLNGITRASLLDRRGPSLRADQTPGRGPRTHPSLSSNEPSTHVSVKSYTTSEDLTHLAST